MRSTAWKVLSDELKFELEFEFESKSELEFALEIEQHRA